MIQPALIWAGLAGSAVRCGGISAEQVSAELRHWRPVRDFPPKVVHFGAHHWSTASEDLMAFTAAALSRFPCPATHSPQTLDGPWEAPDVASLSCRGTDRRQHPTPHDPAHRGTAGWTCQHHQLGLRTDPFCARLAERGTGAPGDPSRFF